MPDSIAPFLYYKNTITSTSGSGVFVQNDRLYKLNIAFLYDSCYYLLYLQYQKHTTLISDI